MSQIIPVIPGTGADPLETITGDTGGPVGPDAAGNINLFGTPGLVTTTGNPGTNTITIDLDDSIASQYDTDAGTAIPVAHILNIIGAGSISTAGAGNTVTITGTGGGLMWVEVLGTSQAMNEDTGYVANNGALVTLTLPAVASFGSIIRVVGKGAGGWLIAQNVGQVIYFGNQTTTPGIGGSLASTDQRDCVELLCITANTEWQVASGPQGNITVT